MEQISVKPDPDKKQSSFEHDLAQCKQPLLRRSTTRKLNEFVKMTYSYKKNRILVAIIPHTMNAEECLQKHGLCILEFPDSNTISSVISSYTERCDHRCVIRLSRTAGNKQLGPKARLKQVAQNSYFVVLKATEIEVAESAVWEVFATQYIGMNTDRATPRCGDLSKLYHQMNEIWSKMSLEMKNLLAHQTKQLLSYGYKDRIPQLAFWLFYKDYFLKSQSGRPHETIRRREMLFKSVLEIWNKQESTNIRQSINEAANYEQQFPLPQCPSSIELTKIFKETETYDPFTITYRQNPEIYADLSLEALERITEAGIDLLTAVASVLPQSDLRFTSWRNIILKLTQQTSTFRTKIGIMGATGLGKSTIINALLDEKDLLPTSFVEACTAAPIEVRFDDSLNSRYRVVITFLSISAWEQEIHMCMTYLNDPSAEYDEATKEAAAKIKAAYPDFTKEEMDLSNLMGVADIKEKLGEVRPFEAETADELTRLLSRFVASKEDTGYKRDWNHEDRLYWPLVESIQLYLKAPLLQSGVVLVDLPGVQDSNKARAAVAKKHQASCSHIFYVSDITRAASDAAIMNFISERGRLQLQHNGIDCNTSIICSKADQMSVSLRDAQSVGVEQKFRQLEAEQKRVNGDILRLQNDLDALEIQWDIDTERYDTMIRELQQLRIDIQNARSGIPVHERHTPILQPTSALRLASGKRARQLLPQGTNSDVDAYLMHDSPREKILNVNKIQRKIKDLNDEPQKVAKQVNALNNRIVQFEREIKALKSTKSSI